jgi:hypothetical protein
VYGGGQSTYEFARAKNLPVAMPEMGASFSPTYGGVSNLETKQGIWRQIFATETRSRFPYLKLVGGLLFLDHNNILSVYQSY